MTEDITSILLPSSRIGVFAIDAETTKVAQALKEDWRFARVDINIYDGGIEKAIGVYGEHTSPDIIIIETNDIGDDFVATLGDLAGVCAQGTDAVVVSPTNDVALYRSLVGMGVRDYLVRPVSENDFLDVISKILIEKHGISSSRLVTVLGAKGGVGTTAISQLIACDIAKNFDQKTVLMDVSGVKSSMGISFGMEPNAHLTEGVRIATSGTEDDVNRMLQPVTDNLSVLTFTSESVLSDQPSGDEIETLVDRLMQKTPVLVLDLSGAAPDVQRRMIERSSHTILVTTGLIASLRNTRTLLTEIKSTRMNLSDLDLVLNMQGLSSSEEVPAAEIKAVLDIEPTVTISFLPKIFAHSEAQGIPVAENKSASDILLKMRPVTSRAAGIKDVVKKGDKGDKSSGIFDFLKKKT